MDLHFLDATFDGVFRAEQQRERIFSVFVTVSVLVACLGFYGLRAFATQRRTQEIGIRKVFGAGVRDIVWLLLWQFSVPVLLANIVAWPIAWYYPRLRVVPGLTPFTSLRPGSSPWPSPG